MDVTEICDDKVLVMQSLISGSKSKLTGHANGLLSGGSPDTKAEQQSLQILPVPMCCRKVM